MTVHIASSFKEICLTYSLRTQKVQHLLVLFRVLMATCSSFISLIYRLKSTVTTTSALKKLLHYGDFGKLFSLLPGVSGHLG